MTTSAPQWPGQEGMHEQRADEQPAPIGATGPVRVVSPALGDVPNRAVDRVKAMDPSPVAVPAGVVDLSERRRRQQRLRRAAARRNRFVVVRDATERDLWAARLRARANLPSPVAITRDIALHIAQAFADQRAIPSPR